MLVIGHSLTKFENRNPSQCNIKFNVSKINLEITHYTGYLCWSSSMTNYRSSVYSIDEIIRTNSFESQLEVLKSRPHYRNDCEHFWIGNIILQIPNFCYQIFVLRTADKRIETACIYLLSAIFDGYCIQAA